MQKNWFVKNINKKYLLKAGNKTFFCQIGAGGLKNAVKKMEGDKSTPTGKWRLDKVYYRSDRVLRPKCKDKNLIKINRITKQCGWCDDINSIYYNKHIKINNLRSQNISYEKLWRKDEAYDIVVIISHNIKPIIKNRGSAIFIHCSFYDKRNTSGCIALKKKELAYLLKSLQYPTFIKI